MSANATVGADELRIADLMTIDPVTVGRDARIEDAEELMRSYRVSGLPVVDEGGHLVGVISQTDLLHLAIPSVQALVRHKGRAIRIGDVMSVPPVTIEAGATVRDAAILMNRERLHRLVAVDDHGRPIGVISAMDFVAMAADA